MSFIFRNKDKAIYQDKGKQANNIKNAFPSGATRAQILTKMQSLIDRDLINGCACGCRGDFEPIK